MLTVIDHPCVKAKLTILRDCNTNCKEFRERVNELTLLIAYEALKNLELQEVSVDTPLCRTTGFRIRNHIVVIPIIRAGIGMLDGLLSLLPDAQVGFLGLARDPVSKKPVEYYRNLPAASAESMALIVDPMLATGGSLAATVTCLKENGYKNNIVLSLLAAPEGVAKMNAEHPEVKIYTGCVDEKLTADKYIFPGLGDAGDRIFGTI